MLSTTRIINALGVHAAVETADVTDSTNLMARRRLAAKFPLPAVLAADSQTAGRGRLGRDFYSPADCGVYMSVVYKTDKPLSAAVTVTAGAAVAAAMAIEEVTGLSPGIKWVNDLYISGRKVCGILTESLPYDGGFAVIVGVGINVSTAAFPPELSDRAGSLGAADVREELIGKTASRILRFAEEGPAAYMDAYRARSVVVGEKIEYTPFRGEPVTAEAVAIDDAGGLVVLLPDGTKTTLSTGEISVCI